MVVLVRGEAEVTSWPLGGCACPDLDLVDHLARLQLTARRLGCEIRLVKAGPELRELLDLVGLTGVLVGPGGSDRRRQVGGEAEGAEQLGVEEAAQPGDAPV